MLLYKSWNLGVSNNVDRNPACMSSAKVKSAMYMEQSLHVRVYGMQDLWMEILLYRYIILLFDGLDRK